LVNSEPELLDGDGSNNHGRPVTIRDIAALAGVDISTVSRALNPYADRKTSAELSQRIQAIAIQHGYEANVLASGLRGGRSRTIGVLVWELTDMHNATMIRGIHEELEAKGFAAVLMETRDDPARRDQAFQFMARRSFDAVIVLSARESDRERLRVLGETRPVVLGMQGLSDSDLLSITSDDYLGGTLVADFLDRLGHRRVAQLTCELDIANLNARRRGFEERANEVGLELVAPDFRAATPSMEDGWAATAQMLSIGGDLPTAIFAHCDTLAFGALRALRSNHISCPGDVSVIGYDDNPMCEYLTPALTTIEVPALDLGRRVARLALDASGGSEAESYEYAPRLIARESTRRLRKLKRGQ
jgi:LacI family transcriptional regulator